MQRMATAADYSPVQAALSLSFSYLVNSIDATALLPEALSRQLITERQRSECASEPDSYKKAEKFLGHLQRAVNGDSSKFHTFVQVLEETNHTNIASRLRDELDHVTRIRSTVEGEQVISVPDTLVEELTNLQFAFANLQLSYEKEVRKSPEAQEQFVQFLPRLLRRTIMHMTPDNSFHSNFYILMEEEVSLFNTFYLKQICNIFPGNVCAATRKLVVEYEELRQRFMTSTTVNQFKALFPASAAPCKLLAGKVTVTLKLKAYWGGNVVHELETFASILDLSGGHFHLYMAKRGCIAVVWLCSTSFVEKQLKAAISEISSSLLQLKGVLQIFIGDDLVWKPAATAHTGDELENNARSTPAERRRVMSEEFIKSKESVLEVGTAPSSRSLPSSLHSREEAITTQPGKPVAKESSVSPPPVLSQPQVKLVPSVQVSSLEPQDLPWEKLLTWSALALLLLSFLAVYYGNGEVVCNSPAHLGSSFVNSACQQSLSHWSYYPLIVFLQSCVLLLPQYLWYSYSKWHVQFFFGALQRFNRHPFTDEGECDLEAFQVVDNLEDRFAKSRYLVRLFYRKILLQLGIWTICRAGTLVMFSKHSSEFKCPTSVLAAEHCSATNNCSHTLEVPFINCYNSQLEHLSSVLIANCFILLIVLACIIYTFTWFFLQVESFKSPNDFDKFYLDSHLTSRHLSFDVTLANDLGFLVEMLSHVDSSLAEVFQEVKVRRYMDHELRKQAEQYRLMKLVVSNGYLKGEDGSDREDDIDSRTRHFRYGFDHDIDGDLKRVYCQLFGGTNILPMSSVHKLIFQCLHYIVLPNENKCAIDITFGTMEYGSALSRAFVQAVSVCFLSQLRGCSVTPANSKQCVNHAKLTLPDTIYTQQVKDINKANAAVQDLVLKNIVPDKRVDRNNRTIVSFVLVGPMEIEQNAFTANILLDHLYHSCCFKRNCCMLTLRPLVIGSRNVSEMFYKFVPVERMFQLDMEKLEKVTSGEGRIQCGPLTCVFELKLYCFKDYGIGHRLYSSFIRR